jgi:hypothetical protein
MTAVADNKVLGCLCLCLLAGPGLVRAQPPAQLENKTGRFVQGKWIYLHTVTDNGRTGLLRYDGRPVVPSGAFDTVQTPWGKMYWWGAGGEDKTLAGWILQAPPDGREGAAIRPDGKAAGAEQIDLDRSGKYSAGRWRFELALGQTTPGSPVRRGRLLAGDVEVQATAVRDYVKTPWGVMYWWGDKPGADGQAGWLPKVPAGLPGRRIQPVIPVESPNAQPGQQLPGTNQLDLTRPGGYESGKWKYVYTIWSANQPGQGSMGQLHYDGKLVEATALGDAVRSPWGMMYWWGPLKGKNLAGPHGWLPTRPDAVSGRQVHPATPAIQRVDLTRPGRYAVGKWLYVYLVWNGPEGRSGSTGRLVQSEAEVEGVQIGQRILTPWGTMYWYGRLSDVRGLSGWLPIRPRGLTRPVDFQRDEKDKDDE